MRRQLSFVGLIAGAVIGAGCRRSFDFTATTGDGMQPPAGACALPTAAPASVGLTQASLDSLAKRADERMSDALVVLRDGRLVGEWYFGRKDRRINIQSVTKAITSLGVGLLLDDGRLPSLDIPISSVFPEFADSGKRDVTLTMVMNHTSGIASGQGEAQFAGVRDIAAFVRQRPMQEPAGAFARYSNVNAQLVGALVETKAGQPMAVLLRDRVFRPLCITDFEWTGDAQGHTYAYSRLSLHARDLAKLGQLVLDTGTWNGTRVLSTATVDSITGANGGRAPFGAGTYTHFWQVAQADSVVIDSTLLTRVRAAGASPSFLAALGPFVGHTWQTTAFKSRLDSALGGGGKWWSTWRTETHGAAEPTRTRGRGRVILHSGSWGQYLVILPETRTVFVRFSNFSHPGRKSEDDAGAWPEFANEVYQRFGKAPR